MDPATRRALHEERARAAFRHAPAPPAGTWRKWLRHPIISLAIPFAIAFCYPQLYKLVTPKSWRPINESQLQEIASLLDDIYMTMINMTFVPPTAIRRGPHEINTTAIICKQDPSVRRLMEIMPYIDSFETLEHDEVYRRDWLSGGEFIDFRKPEYLEEGCDPLRTRGSIYHDLAPTTIPLTSWGHGGWNGDRTWVLMYHTDINAIRVFEGEQYISLLDLDDPSRRSWKDRTDFGLFTHSVEHPIAAMSKGVIGWEEWFDAPTLLRRILHAYQSLAWTPWESSGQHYTLNRDGGWGVNVTIFKDLLRKNGWPVAFNHDQFNVDVIRAKHVPSKYGPAKAAYKRVEQLEGGKEEFGEVDVGIIAELNRSISQLEAQNKKERDEQERWTRVFRIQSRRWRLERFVSELATLKDSISQLCPEGLCIKESDEILHEFHSIEKEYLKAQRSTPPGKTCVWDLADQAWPISLPTDELLHNCISKRQREFYWLELAYYQTRTLALSHCSITNCSLIPQPTIYEAVAAKTEELEREATNDQKKAVMMYEWLPNLPESAERARTEFEMEASAAANGPWYARERIEWFEEMVREEAGREKLWRCWDDERCW